MKKRIALLCRLPFNAAMRPELLPAARPRVNNEGESRWSWEVRLTVTCLESLLCVTCHQCGLAGF